MNKSKIGSKYHKWPSRVYVSDLKKAKKSKIRNKYQKWPSRESLEESKTSLQIYKVNLSKSTKKITLKGKMGFAINP